ncbi:hypothetical protein BGZ95_004348 [Linnemannia exigua]|uniref:Uncharacterized protein n=1 Tax=Linnemannia exigua TaxID=604196 RepID=A0AAD4DHE4_9FUNG|nr:hypothetical protein BGZ95_004348 [Linnemannia exigua]
MKETVMSILKSTKSHPRTTTTNKAPVTNTAATAAENEQAPSTREKTLPLVDVKAPPTHRFATNAQGVHPRRNRVTDSVRLRDELMMWKGITPFILRKDCESCNNNLVYGWCYDCVTCMECCRCIKDLKPKA